MSRAQRFRHALRTLNRYIVFFLLISFVITCSMLLFITTLTAVMDITLTERDVAAAAKLTLGNVIFLSAIVTAIDGVRRKLMYTVPQRRIAAAAREMMRGNFDVRIRRRRLLGAEDTFDEIIDCFNEMAQALQSTETLHTDFIANVSHELKTPLAVIQNYATMLRDPLLDAGTRADYALAITTATKRLSQLVSHILRLSKLEQQQAQQSPTRYDLGEQLCECLLGFESVWEEKNIAIETDIAEGVTVYKDRDMLSLVWNNLLSNAFKFTPEGGTVRLTLCVEDGTAVTQISDTGCGISCEVGARIFDKFYQGDTSHQGEGNGLGLALVKRVIAITNSEISVVSDLGKGTTFTVSMEARDDTH